jgi:GNAT superfamily N-acetyltransferase
VIRFRRYRPTDLPAVLTVFRSNVPVYFAPQEERWIKQTLAAPDCPLYVLIENDDLIGFGGFEIDEFYNCASLVFGMIHRDHHGRGLGRRLLDYRLSKIAEAKNAPRYVAVDTTPHVAPFYQHCGFERIAHWPEGYRHGFDRVDLRLDRQR